MKSTKKEIESVFVYFVLFVVKLFVVKSVAFGLALEEREEIPFQRESDWNY